MAARVELEAVPYLMMRFYKQYDIDCRCHTNPVGQRGEKSLSGNDLVCSVV